MKEAGELGKYYEQVTSRTGQRRSLAGAADCYCPKKRRGLAAVGLGVGCALGGLGVLFSLKHPTRRIFIFIFILILRLPSSSFHLCRLSSISIIPSQQWLGGEL
ncbi:predicted protein [Histoplasma capsulatum G186AR]|uniref:Uncharacterized protein n=1 Tax=Ajellomyces capsulatus (strain G186AR / H82 / ATCC MYA-2454 / RMSCC 2432) TaxID=447093 RepID=C0NX95_AJECG|nr:uncharacterized protein HCBG_08087 [Histoplasma capsulatum G186AR]EEH03961.1 predicted protein [Histoplasma capsulatum G186AR]